MLLLLLSLLILIQDLINFNIFINCLKSFQDSRAEEGEGKKARVRKNMNSLTLKHKLKFLTHSLAF